MLSDVEVEVEGDLDLLESFFASDWNDNDTIVHQDPNRLDDWDPPTQGCAETIHLDEGSLYVKEVEVGQRHLNKRLVLVGESPPVESPEGPGDVQEMTRGSPPPIELPPLPTGSTLPCEFSLMACPAGYAPQETPPVHHWFVPQVHPPPPQYIAFYPQHYGYPYPFNPPLDPFNMLRNALPYQPASPLKRPRDEENVDPAAPSREQKRSKRHKMSRVSIIAAVDYCAKYDQTAVTKSGEVYQVLCWYRLLSFVNHFRRGCDVEPIDLVYLKENFQPSKHLFERISPSSYKVHPSNSDWVLKNAFNNKQINRLEAIFTEVYKN